MWYILKEKSVFQALPSQTAQQVLLLVEKAWKSFFNASKEYRKHPEKFLGRPRPPRYKKKDGEFLLVFTNQQCRIRDGWLLFPKKMEIKPVKTRIKGHINHVRIVPRGLFYMLEIVYEKEAIPLNFNEKRVLGIDL